MPARKTKSELLFEEVCKSSGVVFRGINSHSASRTPDYELDIAGNRIVVEVKQIEPDEDDEKYASDVASGFATQTRNPDIVAQPVRKAIKVSSGQFRQYLIDRPNIPALLVVFDAADNSYTDPYAIKVALFGHERVVVSIPKNSTTPILKESGFAPNNRGRIRSNKETQLSAVVAMHKGWSRETRQSYISLIFYHNPYASRPFDTALWGGEHIQHVRLDTMSKGRFRDWIPA